MSFPPYDFKEFLMQEHKSFTKGQAIAKVAEESFEKLCNGKPESEVVEEATKRYKDIHKLGTEQEKEGELV
jgi:hypothetical protein